MGLLSPARPFCRVIAGERGGGQGSFKGLCREMNQNSGLDTKIKVQRRPGSPKTLQVFFLVKGESS